MALEKLFAAGADLQGVGISEQCGYSVAHIVAQAGIVWILEAAALDCWPSISGNLLPGFLNTLGVAFENEYNVIPSGVKREEIVVIFEGDQKRRKALEGRDTKKGRECL